jgi:hypothetical protein
MNGMTLTTQVGSWNPLVWLLSFVIVIVVVYAIRSRGRNKYKPRTEQTLPFFSGNIAPYENIRSSNLYWGFFRALGRYYKWLIRAHTGIVNDYVYCFALLLVVIMAAMALGGLL